MFIDNNRLYHRTIVEVGGNAQLSALIVNLQLPVVMIQVGRAMRPEHAELSHRDHVAIAEAVLAGDAGAAEQAMRRMCADRTTGSRRCPTARSSRTGSGLRVASCKLG